MQLSEARDRINSFAIDVQEIAKRYEISDFVVAAMLDVTEDTPSIPPTCEGVMVSTRDAQWGVILAAQLLGFAKSEYLYKQTQENMEKMHSAVAMGHSREQNRQEHEKK